jgi:hypothetical protein
VGFWSFLTGAGLTNTVTQPPVLGSPFAEPSTLDQAIVGDIFGDLPDEVITPEIAMRVPEVKRALKLHTSLVAPLPFEVYEAGSKAPVQPFWVANTDYPVASPYLRNKGLVTDLFLWGWALLGATLDPATDLPRDMIHIPRAYWNIDPQTGSIQVDPNIPSEYRQRLILIPLGSNGLLIDGIDSIRQARKLELARQARIDSPPASVELHMTDSKFDEMSKKEKEALASSYSSNRAKYGVSVTPSYIETKSVGSGSIELFEAGMNSLRIQLANHASVPASALEASKEGGTGGQMSYSNQTDKQSELWLFGSSEFAYAITARLSMDDVVGPDAEVRADLTALDVPAPTELSPESPVTPPAAPAPPAPTE